MRPGTRVSVRGDRWIVRSTAAHADCHSVRLAGCGGANAGIHRTLLVPFDRVHPSVPSRRLRVVGRRRWTHHVARALIARHPFGGLRAAVDASFDVLPFQLEPALAVLRHGRLRILIADDVGLGKTVQAGILLNELADADGGFRAIVLAPAGLRDQWRRELESRFSLETTLADSRWVADCAGELPSDVNPWSLPGIFVASMDLVKRPEVLRALEEVTWDACVVDEAHGVTPGTARLAAARAIGSRSRRVVLLTATPPDGDAAHFAALGEIGREPHGPAITEFRRTRREVGAAARRKTIILPVRASREEAAMHRLLERYTALVWREAGARGDARARLAALILRKRALSSARSLARSVERRLAILGAPGAASERQLALPLGDEDPLDDSPPDDILGASGLADLGAERTCLQDIAAAAAEAERLESKLTFLLRLIGRIGEPAVVFTEYRDTLGTIASALPAHVGPLILHGALPPHERTAVQLEFNRSGGLLLATDAASEGLNLHERCRLIVHFELPWTPMRLEQRTGRVDRLGQTRRVHELLLVSRDTAERFVLAPLVKRLRAAAIHNPRALSAFDESAIAASLMEGFAPAPVTLSPPPVQSASLGEEARVEADRLSLQRRLRARKSRDSRPRQDGGGTLVHAARRRGSASGALVVVLVTVTNAGGQLVHSELVPVRAPATYGAGTRQVGSVLAWAQRLLETSGDDIVSAVRADRSAAMADVVARVKAAAAAALSRERFLAGSGTPVRPLTQPGLFDRRALRRAAAANVVATRIEADVEVRIRALEQDVVPTLDAEIIAIRADLAGSR